MFCCLHDAEDVVTDQVTSAEPGKFHIQYLLLGTYLNVITSKLKKQTHTQNENFSFLMEKSLCQMDSVLSIQKYGTIPVGIQKITPWMLLPHWHFLEISESTTSTTRRTTLPLIGGYDYCFLEDFQATCPRKSQLSIQDALLGRMSESSRCINQNDKNHIGCYDSVVLEVREKCDGRNICRFPVTELGPLVTKCPLSTMPYLYVEHQCVEGNISSLLIFWRKKKLDLIPAKGNNQRNEEKLF